MAAFDIQEALNWKEKIETVIDQVCISWKQFHNNLSEISASWFQIAA